MLSPVPTRIPFPLEERVRKVYKISFPLASLLPMEKIKMRVLHLKAIAGGYPSL
jgi:hypothetical protein